VPLFRHAGKIEFVDDFASSRRHDTHPPISLASKVVMAARIVLGCSVLVAAGALRIWWPSLEEALSTALFLCGFVVLAHVGISHFLTLSTSSQATPDERNEVVRHLVEIIIAAAGTVLGLMTVFGEAPIGLTLKVAVAALSSALFTGVVVFGLHGPHMTTTSTRADVARSVLVNIVFFSLILGVSCMLMALIFDETVKPVK
jgi:hypothetical protein